MVFLGRYATISIVAALFCVTLVESFINGVPARHHQLDGCSISSLTQLHASAHNGNQEPCLSRKHFVSANIISLGVLFVNSQPSGAEEQEPKTISACKVAVGGKPTNCVSTASVRQVDCYEPPWTFQVSEDEAMARLKGVIASDPSLTLVEEVSPFYLRVTCNRGPLDVTDELEFLVNTADKVVTFKSYEIGEPNVSDFGANRKRLEGLRKRAGVFGVMGDGLTADSYAGGRGTGPLQQLKAFYGLQSGGGYEEVFEDD